MHGWQGLVELGFCPVEWAAARVGIRASSIRRVALSIGARVFTRDSLWHKMTVDIKLVSHPRQNN